MKPKFQEKGQALILIALAAILLFGISALAIDGSRAYSDRRYAQNAADSAALAGALAYTRGKDIVIAVNDRVKSNGYADNGTTHFVSIDPTDVPTGGCPGNPKGKDIKVTIITIINTSLAQVIGQTQVTNKVTATSRSCGYILAPLFNGNAIVGLNPNSPGNPNAGGCAFDAGNSGSVDWTIEGSGIFSNNCAFKGNKTSVTLDSGSCAATPGGYNAFSPPCVSQAIKYPQDVKDIMPPNPCVSGGVGLPPPASGSTFSNGIYCISNMDQYDKKDIVLNNATLYVTDTKFDLDFDGGGGFSGSATNDPNSPYYNYYMIVAYTDPPCPDFHDKNSQVINYRGNGSGSLTGTILAPSACIDLRGNATTQALNSQIIAYNVSSNGNASVKVIYNENEQHKNPFSPTITLLR
jgi:Putative Flp pilus-assembly TadE/G-like